MIVIPWDDASGSARGWTCAGVTAVQSVPACSGRHGSGRKEKGALQAEPPGGVTTEPDDHALGRSRGGLTTKLHLACEQGQKPLAVVLTARQRGDSPPFIPVLAAIRVPRPTTGRPRNRPDRVLADKAHTSKANRAYLRRRGIAAATIPSKTDQDAHRRAKGSKGRTATSFRP